MTRATVYMGRTKRFQVTVEYLLLIGVLLLTVLIVIQKGTLGNKVAELYDKSGNGMSSLVGRNNDAGQTEIAVNLSRNLRKTDLRSCLSRCTGPLGICLPSCRSCQDRCREDFR